MPEVDYTKMGTSEFDIDVWMETQRLIEENDLSYQDILENFMLFYRRVNFAKFLTHIELFNKTQIKINKEWEVFKKILNSKNNSRKECLLLPFRTISKALKFKS